MKHKQTQNGSIDADLLPGEYRLRLYGSINLTYLGRTVAQEMSVPGDGKRLVFWAPEVLLKLALPNHIDLGPTILYSLARVIDAGTGKVNKAGIAVVMRREGLEQEIYVEVLTGLLDLATVDPLTGHLTCLIANTNAEEKIDVDLCFLGIGEVVE
jgi:hypothetical protein